jgi:hypothetical protein
LTPSGILHMAAFVTLCEAYMGIEPHFDLWNYFFSAQLQQGSDAEAVALGNVDIFVLSEPRVDTDVPLPAFMGCRLVLQPNWGYGVARMDRHSL